MTSITLDIDITNGGGDLLFFKPETDPVTRRLIVDIGSKVVSESKFILESYNENKMRRKR